MAGFVDAVLVFLVVLDAEVEFLDDSLTFGMRVRRMCGDAAIVVRRVGECKKIEIAERATI